jgi:hypothetical protein|tara:strand:+ start:980 stop:1252 length:273 start_codon:yes stop_codon:yes gene_type:complete
MPHNNWETQRAEIATWLSGWTGMIKKWIDRILDNDDHDVNKNKIIGVITEWITYLEEMKLKIMKMSDTAPKSDKPTFSHFGDDEEDKEDS